MELNILLRGQSNALLFADRGGLYALEQQLEGQTGADIHILSEYGTASSTIYSGTAFLDWDTDGQQAGLLTHLQYQPANIRDNPTVTLWLHNEDEQKGSGSQGEWLQEVRADAAMVRDVLQQGAESTPYLFTPIPYNYGQNWSWYEGMLELSADASFNASMSNAFDGTAMDGDGYPNSSHMGDGDMQMVAAGLAEDLMPILARLMDSRPPRVDPEPVILDAGAGTDNLVLKISQDYWQGDAQYAVSVDGVQIGGTFTASALSSSGQSDTLTLHGNWAAGTHQVSVHFLNDAWGGSAAADRNLDIVSASYNGQAIVSAAQAIDTDSTPGGFAFTEAASDGLEQQIIGTAAGDMLAGGQGHDTIVGLAGNDTLRGGSRADLLRGGEGDDVLAGGGGDDVLMGGGGADRIVLAVGRGHDTVVDFQAGLDRLASGAGITLAGLQKQATAGGLLLTHDAAGDGVLLVGVTSIAAADMVFASSSRGQCPPRPGKSVWTNPCMQCR